jgi:uncharacterized protein YfaS (alpha-2-macroglobulin family)
MDREDALEPPMPKESLVRSRERYDILLDLAAGIDSWSAWRLAADRLTSAGRYGQAYAAAWRALRMADLPRDRASSMDLFTKLLIAEGNVDEALTVLADAQALQASDLRESWRKAVEDRVSIRVTDVVVDVEAPSPRACLVLSHTLPTPLPVRIEDYVRVGAGHDLALRAAGNRICLSGLQFGAQVPVTLLAGLPGEKGAKLRSDVERTTTLTAREARLLFGNGTYVLPRVGDETVPLRSVNLDQAALTLYRVPDRGLVPFLKSGMDQSNLNRWAEDNLMGNLGAKVWQGTVSIEDSKNADVTTLVPVRDMLPQTEPGLYALVATEVEEEDSAARWQENQTQWLLISDLGLMTLAGEDGLHVFVHSLAEASARRGVALRLVARNNAVLAETVSDDRGYAAFSAALINGEGGNSPAALVAETGTGDYGFVKLTGPALDLSDRGAEGRVSSGPLDAFFYTERGIYRPGGTVRMTALLRDYGAVAVPGMPLTLKIIRPDGVEALKELITGDATGSFAFDYPLSPGARTGQWRVSLHADHEQESVGGGRFMVEDFVPERIAATVETAQEALTGGEPLEALIRADFLYGAPGSNLKGDLNVTLAVDPAPFGDYRRFSFGMVQDDFSRTLLGNRPFVTGPEGTARVEMSAFDVPDTTKPLVARLVAEVRDVGGRPVSAVTALPVRTRALFLGLRALHDGAFEREKPAELEAVALDRGGNAVAGRALTAVWVREQHYFNWYQQGGRWRYRADSYDEVIAEEAVESRADGTVPLSRLLPAGRYRLDLMANEGTPAGSLRFHVGWWSGTASPDVPDALELTLESNALTGGGTMKGFIKAPFAGKALLAVVGERLLATKTIALDEDGSRFELKVGDDWGAGAHLLVTALRPGAGDISRLPVRATGVAWVSIDREARTRTVRMDPPETALPKSSVTIPLRLEGPVPKGPVKVTVAAVDEGILRLTRYQTPDPEGFYFDPRGFGYDIRDIYGRLIRSEEGTRGTIRSGGGFEEMVVSGMRTTADDASGNRFAAIARVTRAVSLIRRDVAFDRRGRASVTLDLPDFTGRLRLMAVAHGLEVVGSGEDTLVVRTPVVAELLLPRFLAPGDEATATLSLQNLSGKDTRVDVALSPDSAALELVGISGPVALADGERKDLPVTVRGVAPGTSGVALRVGGRGLPTIERHWDISVRAAWPYATEKTRLALAPGEAGSFEPLGDNRYLPGTVERRLTVSSRPNLEAGRLLEALYGYSYRCSEQLVSRAFPALYHAPLDRLYSLPVDRTDAQTMVDRAIMRLLDRQKSNGSFGVWSVRGSSNSWLDVYVADFLIRAREAGYTVGEASTDLSLARLKRMVSRRGESNAHYNAYAFYVLARLGEVSASEVRYFADQFADKLNTPIALAQTAAALQFTGEEARAQALFVRAVRSTRRAGVYHGDYGTDLRHRAAVAALIAEARPSAETLAALADQLEGDVGTDQWLSTQEMSWLARAAAAYAGEGDSRLMFTLNGRKVSAEQGMWTGRMTDPDAAIALENRGETAIRALRLVRGVPASPPAPEANGFRIERTYFDMDGNPVSPDAVPRNSRLVVRLSVTVTENAVRDPLVVDMLPAGFEIETTEMSGIGFLRNLASTEFTDARDDRFVAALKTHGRASGNSKPHVLAYVVRAVTPGAYTLPGPFVEDMYLPQYRAQGQAATMLVED